ncbi:hypothetical protein N9V88_02585 [bacterium]|nr:hypothetical protein [Mariniblastus sp.]MDB2318456.1 hypothetical protein [bacterium]MDB4623688.1 hypothetical protein [bacterium]MDC0265714.1 hypothetical protein [Mariniblastus sp.]
MRQIFLFCIVLSLNIPLSVVGQETEELRKLTREVEVLRKKGLSHIKLIENVYDREKDEAENIFQDEVAKRRNETLTKLNAEIESALEAKNLDKAIKLKATIEKVDEKNYGTLLDSKPAIKANANKTDFSKLLAGKWLNLALNDGGHVITIYPDGAWAGVNGVSSPEWKWKFSPSTKILFMTRPSIGNEERSHSTFMRETYELTSDGKLLSGQTQTGTKLWLVKLDD